MQTKCQRWSASITFSTTLGKVSEKVLIKQLQGNCLNSQENAFTEIYNRSHQELWRYICSRTYDKEQAKDIWGEVWCVASRDLPNPEKYHYQGKPIVAWLKTVASNQIKKFKASYTRQTNLVDKLQSEYLSEDEALKLFHQAENRRQVSQGLKQLKEQNKNQYQAVFLRFYNDYSYAKIATVLNVSEGYAGKLLSRGLKKLTTILAQVV